MKINQMTLEKNKKRPKYSTLQQWIIDAVLSKRTEDKEFVSINTIVNYITTYNDVNRFKNPKTEIRRQITRLINRNVLTLKRLSVKLN